MLGGAQNTLHDREGESESEEGSIHTGTIGRGSRRSHPRYIFDERTYQSLAYRKYATRRSEFAPGIVCAEPIVNLTALDLNVEKGVQLLYFGN